jgi:hypothetical protein
MAHFGNAPRCFSHGRERFGQKLVKDRLLGLASPFDESLVDVAFLLRRAGAVRIQLPVGAVVKLGEVLADAVFEFLRLIGRTFLRKMSELEPKTFLTNLSAKLLTAMMSSYGAAASHAEARA